MARGTHKSKVIILVPQHYNRQQHPLLCPDFLAVEGVDWDFPAYFFPAMYLLCRSRSTTNRWESQTDSYPFIPKKVDDRKLKYYKTEQKSSRSRKWWSSTQYMDTRLNSRWSMAYDINLDVSTVQSVLQNRPNNLISTVQLLLPIGLENSSLCTSYGAKMSSDKGISYILHPYMPYL